MINKLRKYVSPKLRRKVTRLLPAKIRHCLVDWYISKQASYFEKLYKIKGPKWIEEIPGWERGFDWKNKTQSVADLIPGFWQNIRNDGANNTADYFAQLEFSGDTNWLKHKLNTLLPNKGTVLDFGCNACRVLHHIVEDGFRGIGADINGEAIEVGRKTFSSLEGASFYVGDGPESLKEIESHTVDLIYTNQVLRHVAPEMICAVVAEFSRIAPKYIITLEDEASLSYRTFPHNYLKIFRSYGWRSHSIQYGIDLSDIGTTLGGLGVMFRTYVR